MAPAAAWAEVEANCFSLKTDMGYAKLLQIETDDTLGSVNDPLKPLGGN
jgi:hypothetical protein